MSEMQVQYIAHSGSDLLVVNAARVSFAKEEVEKHKNKISELQQKINDINDRFKNPNNPNYVSTDHKIFR